MDWHFLLNTCIKIVCVIVPLLTMVAYAVLAGIAILVSLGLTILWCRQATAGQNHWIIDHGIVPMTLSTPTSIPPRPPALLVNRKMIGESPLTVCSTASRMTTSVLDGRAISR